MKNAVHILIFLFAASLCEAQSIYFNQTYDDSTRGDDGQNVINTNDGGYLAVGNSYGISGNDTAYIQLVKTDAFGNVSWKTFYKRPNYKCSTRSNLLITADGNYIIAGIAKDVNNKSDGLILKIDINGVILWTKIFTGTYSYYFNEVVETSNGNFLIVGATDKYSTGSNYNVYLLKTDSAGNLIWEKNYGGGGHDDCFSIEKTSDGGYVLGGITNSWTSNYDIYVIKTDSGGVQEWYKILGFNGNDGGSVIPLSDGGYIIAGLVTLGFSNYQGYIAKLNSTGTTILWDKLYGGIYDDFFDSVVALPDGSFVMAGTTQDTLNSTIMTHGWIMKVNAVGDSLWSRSFEKWNYAEQFYDIKQTPDGGFIACGYASALDSNFLYTQDMWLVKVDSLGCDTAGCAIGTNIEEEIGEEQVELKLYPNPAENHVVLELEMAGISDFHIIIYNLMGQTVYEEIKENREGKVREQMDISGFPAGIYLVNVRAGGLLLSRKLVKQ